MERRWRIHVRRAARQLFTAGSISTLPNHKKLLASYGGDREVNGSGVAHADPTSTQVDLCRCGGIRRSRSTCRLSNLTTTIEHLQDATQLATKSEKAIPEYVNLITGKVLPISPDIKL